MEKLCCFVRFVTVSCLRHFVRPILPRVQDPHKPQASERKIPLWKLSLHFILFEKLLPGCMVGQQFCFPPYSLTVALGYRSFMYRQLKLQHPPRANPGHLTVHRAREGRNLNVALEGLGIWTRFISSSSVMCRWVFRFLQGLTDFQGRISPLLVNNALKTVFKWSLKVLLRHISLWQSWTVFDWRRNLSLRRGISVTMGGAFERLFCPEEREFEQANLQKFKCPGGMLKLQFDWYIIF